MHAVRARRLDLARPRPHVHAPVALVAVLLAALALPAGAAAARQTVQAEGMKVPERAGKVVKDRRAAGRRALVLTGRGEATRTLRLRRTSRLSIVARGNRCKGTPRLAVSVDDRKALEQGVSGRRWTARRLPRALAAGRHEVAVRLANPRRGHGCRRTLRIDSLALIPTRSSDRAMPSPDHQPSRQQAPADGIWRPTPGTTWQWQLSTPVDESIDAQMYDIDLFNNPASVVASLQAKGRKVVCYFSAGSYEPDRPDSGAFPAEVLGSALEGWPDERWLDIRRLDVLGPIMERRMDLCKAKGADGVEPDNIDGYSNASGFPLTAADQLAYNRFLASAAHARGLSIGLKNDLDQARELEPDFDFAINEQCFEYGECNLLQPFVAANKAVFNAEYTMTLSSFCAQAKSMGISAIRKNLDLDAAREAC
jgi:hypothetical protein